VPLFDKVAVYLQIEIQTKSGCFEKGINSVLFYQGIPSVSELNKVISIIVFLFLIILPWGLHLLI
jgi:hypothetical protein